jgi:hypothetical protein
MEKIREGHMEMLADVRENYQTELSKVKGELEKYFGDSKAADQHDMERVKENFSVR